MLFIYGHFGIFAFFRHSERNEMQSKNLKVDVSTALNMTKLRSDILLAQRDIRLAAIDICLLHWEKVSCLSRRRGLFNATASRWLTQ